jgi:sporulation protein YlmC with PRC-barrel domain
MANQEVSLELLLGKQVYALNGKSVGRLEEACATLERGECRVTEFRVGKYAMFERVSAWEIARAILGLFGPIIKSGYRVPWDKIDLSNSERLTLTCSVTELRPLDVRSKQ